MKSEVWKHFDILILKFTTILAEILPRITTKTFFLMNIVFRKIFFYLSLFTHKNV